MLWKIAKIGKNEVVSFAAAELKKYMSQIDPSKEYITLMYKKYDPSITDVIWLGQDEAFPLPKVQDADKDDAVSIEVHGRAGYITGTNPRSVLIAAYRFLRELGCAFVRPGVDGEVIPSYDLFEADISVFEAASYRHRAICIEGAVNEDHVIDNIDWMPKVGMNGYFNQFRVPYEFYDRWYSHKGNPLYESEAFSMKDAEGIMNESIYEMKKRGLLYHAAGHGWTCDPFGIEGAGWDVGEINVPENVRQYLALVNGERKFWGGVPLNTNLCYSNPYVIETMSNAIADYCVDVPEVDYLHVWLADGHNNHCECENCKDRRPADFYVDLLNRIDEVMTERGIDTKIVFLIYVDLLWEPQAQRIVHPERFTLMFAPIARTYSQAMNKDAKGCLAPYVRNKITAPRSTGDALESLRGWQEMFRGDSFVFDYHYMWDHCKDPGYYRMAQILTEDAENLHGIGLNGYISCQTQRSFLPTGLGMYLLGGTLWRGKTDFESEAVKYFAMTFGEDAEACRQYLARLSELFDPPTLRGEKKITDHPERYAQIREHVEAFARVLEKHREEEDPCRARSWEILRYHAKICVALAEILALMAEEKRGEAKAKWRALRDMMRRNESRYQNVFYMPLFVAVWEYQIAQDLWGEVWYGE